MLPASVKTVCQGAFARCTKLTHAILDEGLEVLGAKECTTGRKMIEGVFQQSALEFVELPSTLKRIEQSAFKYCLSLKNITLPEGLEYIGKYCFEYSSLETVAIPQSVTKTDTYAFHACMWLKSPLPVKDYQAETFWDRYFYEQDLRTRYYPSTVQYPRTSAPSEPRGEKILKPNTSDSTCTCRFICVVFFALVTYLLMRLLNV